MGDKYSDAIKYIQTGIAAFDDVSEEVTDMYKLAIQSLQKINKLKDMVAGSIDHFDYEDAMDLLYDLKTVIER